MTGKADDATLLELTFRAGVWEVTRDGAFYGRYDVRQQAFDAVEAAAHAIVASGGCADILLRGERRRPTALTAARASSEGRPCGRPSDSPSPSLSPCGGEEEESRRR